jgi:hypothetical protein
MLRGFKTKLDLNNMQKTASVMTGETAVVEVVTNQHLEAMACHVYKCTSIGERTLC